LSAFDAFAALGVRAFIHGPQAGSSDVALVLTHGAGTNCEAPLLVALATAFGEAGITVLRMNLPFREKRLHGPPYPGSAAEDRAGLRRAVEALRPLAAGRVFLGGHSYGGRQASILATEAPGLADGLLLLSYPLHPPRNRSQLRTAHFPKLETRSLFVHGTRDPFGSLEEMTPALTLIPAETKLVPIEGAAHDLRRAGVVEAVLAAFRDFFHTGPR
jgi:predicted alpha/beta-hydrolase family hydrolase